MEVKLVAETRFVEDFLEDIVAENKGIQDGPEYVVAHNARISNTKNQASGNIEKLLNYCRKHNHWSIFEMADLTFEITTSRAIAAQLLRHRSFSFQEFSQRYSNDLLEIEFCEARRQDDKNRQNSIDDLPPKLKQDFIGWQESGFNRAKALYEKAIEAGVAKECARMLLPLGTTTRLYMKGSIRSWMHYLQVRCGNGTQQEHMDIANAITDIIRAKYPLTYSLIDAV